MAWKELSPSAALAINLADLKAHLRLSVGDEDQLLTLYTRAAMQFVETRTRRALISRSFRLEMPEFPKAHGDSFELPLAPVSSVQSIQYYDTQGNITTWGTENYALDATSLPPRIVPAYSVPYPYVQSQHADGVQVSFTAGYGATSSSIPQGLQFIVMLLAGHFWANRMPVEAVGGAGSEIPYTLQFAMDSYKIASL
jgi:uncharacterized phiE125 gp8 family phage protein